MLGTWQWGLSGAALVAVDAEVGPAPSPQSCPAAVARSRLLSFCAPNDYDVCLCVRRLRLQYRLPYGTEHSVSDD